MLLKFFEFETGLIDSYINVLRAVVSTKGMTYSILIPLDHVVSLEL